MHDVSEPTRDLDQRPAPDVEPADIDASPYEEPLRAVAAAAGTATGTSLRRHAGHTHADPLGGAPVPGGVLAALRRRQSAGHPLPDEVAHTMGEQFGADLTGVRVHTDGEADRISRSLSADAFTYGSDVYFTQGRFDPASHSGQQLLAHELAHVVQDSPSSGPAGPTVGANNDPAEADADRAATKVVSALRRHAADPYSHDADLEPPHAHDHPPTLRRHGSPEHLILGNIGPKDLRKIPDAKALVKELGMNALKAEDKDTLREAIHVVLQERQRIRDWQNQAVGRGDPAAAGQIFQVKIVSLDNDAKNGKPGPTLPVLATYGEMNTLADYFGSVDDLYAVSNDTMHKVLQTEREDYYNYLGTLLKELTAEDYITETYKDEDGNDKTLYYYRPESWYQQNLNAVFGPKVGYTESRAYQLSGQGFEGTQSGIMTAGAGSWIAGMHGIDTVVDADPGTKAKAGGGVWGATARNACHFAPQSWHSWKAYHLKARELALEAFRQKAFAGAFPDESEIANKKAGEAENEAWVNNGFGDHYLQDSFASGHLLNKTLVMQWYLEFINNNWSLFGPRKEEWARLMQMTTAHQPLLAGNNLYDKDVDLSPSGPQAIDKHGTAAEAFETANLVNPVPPDLEPLLLWWRAQIGQNAEKKTILRSELERAPGATPQLITRLVALPMVLDKGKPYSSFVPIFGKDDHLYMLNETEGISHDKARSGQAYDAGATMTYAAYGEFMKNSLVQSGSGDLHNYFCKNGLDVQNDEGDVIFRIYGDYVMLTQGGGMGVEISAATAQMSQAAIAEIAANGRTNITVPDIMARFPSKVAVPEKIFGVGGFFGLSNEAVGGEAVPTETLPLDKWHEQLHPVLLKLFGKGSGTIKDRATWAASRLPTKKQLASLKEVVPHAGAEF